MVIDSWFEFYLILILATGYFIGIKRKKKNFYRNIITIYKDYLLVFYAILINS